MLLRFLKRLIRMESGPAARQHLRPSLYASEVTFSDGTTINLEADDLVILVGPNNSGKSAALRQIQSALAHNVTRPVVRSIKTSTYGTSEQFREHVRENSQIASVYGDLKYVGYNYAFRVSELDTIDLGRSEKVRDFFVLRCSTDDRLSGSNPVKAIAYRKDQPSHPMHLLVMDREVEKRISAGFSQAFGHHLYVDRAGGADVALYVGLLKGEDLPSDAFSKDSVEFFENDATPLSQQGDGMRAFATLALNTLAISQQSVLLIDEPEAFLHPPQARLIGRLIASEANGDRQIFIATHSSDILRGVLDVPSRNVHILRITRAGDVNNVNPLDPKLAKIISADPLIRYSGIFDGIFYRHVVLCEADTDCQFYSVILDLPEVSGAVRPDVLFVQGSGKHRLAKLARMSRQLGVAVSTIVDVDILREKTVFRENVEAAGGTWKDVEPLWRDITGAIDSQKAKLTLSQVVSATEEALGQLRRGECDLSDFYSIVRDSVRSNSPWEAVKRAGRSALPAGDIVTKFDKLLELCGGHGLWIVPVGELEGFCRSIGGAKGGAWIAKVLETEDLELSSELVPAREFMKGIWQRALSIDV